MPAIVSCLTTSYGRFGGQAAVEHLHAAGLESLELPIRTAGTRSPLGDEPLITTDSSRAELKRVERLFDDHAIRIASCNITSGNPLDREVVAITNRKLELAHHLGVELVVGGAGEQQLRGP